VKGLLVSTIVAAVVLADTAFAAEAGGPASVAGIGAGGALPPEVVLKIGDWQVTGAEITAEGTLLPAAAIARLHSDSNAARAFAFDWYSDALFARAAEKEGLFDRVPGLKGFSETIARDAIARVYARDLLETRFKPSETEIQQLYAMHKAEVCTAPARYRVARAGVLLGRKATPQEIESATKRMEEIERRLVAGEEFASVAGELSDLDPKTAMGEWISEEDVGQSGDPDGITSLKVGERSKAIESHTGRTIYSMLEREEARTLTLPECRARLEQSLTAQFQRDIVMERVDKLGKEFDGAMNIDAFVAALRAVPAKPIPAPPMGAGPDSR